MNVLSPLGALDELLQAQLAVFVFIHLTEDFVGAFLRSAFVFGHFHYGANHFINCLQNKQTTASGERRGGFQFAA